jgi:predicted TIM-barrel fold metal-dependent hydrolase
VTSIDKRVALVLLLGLIACRPTPPPVRSDDAVVQPPAEPVWHLGKPIIDSHVHIYPTMVGLARALEVFDQVGVDRFAIKSAGSVGTPRYKASLAMQQVMGDRMRSFANVSWKGIDAPDYAARQVRLLEQADRDGIVGIKIFKALGLSVRTGDGALLKVDDPRLAPLFEACGRLGLIVAWHVADPVAFFEPVSPRNERYDELSIAEGWSFHGKDYPSHDELIAARDRVIARHPGTIFLLIHLANYPENIDYVDQLLDTYANVYVDTSARVPEFGRHAADKVRALFVKHQDRVLFGSDFITGGNGNMQLGSVEPGDRDPDTADALRFFSRHWRYFETDAPQIDHPTPIQGRWKVDAIGLAPEVLEKLYITNAEELIWAEGPPQPYRKSAVER